MNKNKESKKKYYLKNKEYILKRNKLYRDNNKEKISAQKKEWARKNSDNLVIKVREYRRKNRDKTKKWNTKQRYNLDLEDVNNILIKQNNLCKICNDSLTQYHIDHNHKTNFVRGILCKKCNTGLGMFRDNTDYLFSAIEYLKENEKSFTEKIKELIPITLN